MGKQSMRKFFTAAGAVKQNHPVKVSEKDRE
jgi:hypothetical protein